VEPQEPPDLPAQVDAAITEPGDVRARLRAVVSLRLLTEQLEFARVEEALRAGLSWTDIADVLGVTRQAVHKKYATRISPLIDVPRRKRT
jgi:hypothetical protein